MEQTPIHEDHNPDLLKMIPTESKFLIEVGCSSGAIAREFKKITPSCDYFGIEIDAEYAALAGRYCDATLVADIEKLGDDFWGQHAHRDCWIFGDTLEHLRDPWAVLRKIRRILPDHGSVVVCIPNAQNWSIQARLSAGIFRYERSGLLDRTHLRWFTWETMLEMFRDTGFMVEGGEARIFEEAARDAFLPLIAEMARLAGRDPQVAVEDSLPYQYVIRARPA